MLKRLSIIGAAAVLCAVGIYFGFKPSSHAISQKALLLLAQNNFKDAEEKINALNKGPCPLSLYKGYIYQASGRLKEADTYFQKALKEGKQPGFFSEVRLAQAVNAFLEMRYQDFYTLVASAAAEKPDLPYLPFFEGVVHYLRAEFKEALHSWSCLSECALEANEFRWLNNSCGRFFPESWRQLHKAHCLAEEGDFFRAREILDKENARIDVQDVDMQRLAALFLGLTYLKEAGCVPHGQRGSFYKLAHFYFDRSGLPAKISKERSLVCPHLSQEIQTLLCSDLSNEQISWSIELIHILQKWNAQDALDNVADRFAKKLMFQVGPINDSLCQTLKKEFVGNSFLHSLTQKLFGLLKLQLHEGNGDTLFHLWSLVQCFTVEDTTAHAKEIAFLATEEIFNAIKKDSETLDTTKQFITFWNSLEHTPQEQERLVRLLLLQSQLLWQKEGQELKGKELMQLCLQVCSNRTATMREIENFLFDLYTRAEESNLIARLSLIYDTMSSFAIKKQDLYSPSKLANHLADAEYLYHAKNFTAAVTHAEWVLKLNPDNQQAIKILGLSSFYLGEFGKSFLTLSRLSNFDDQTHKALILSQVFSTQEPGKHIAQIDSTKSFEKKGD